MLDGSVTLGYRADRDTVLKLLDEALATELVRVLRYKRHACMAEGLAAEAVAAEFAEHAREEQEHADRIAGRIVQLGGEPDFDPDGLSTRSHSEYVPGDDLVTMIREDLIAERIAIESYTEMIRFIADDDPTTRRMLEDILAVEEEHADDLASPTYSRASGCNDVSRCRCATSLPRPSSTTYQVACGLLGREVTHRQRPTPFRSKPHE